MFRVFSPAGCLLLCLLSAGIASATFRPDRLDPRFAAYKLNAWQHYDLRGAESASVKPWAVEPQLRWTNEGSDAVLTGSLQLDTGFSADFQLVGTSRDDGMLWLGSTKERDTWTGRLQRGLIRYRSQHFTLRMGRDYLSRETGSISELGLSREQSGADFLEYVLSTTSGNLQLQVSAAKLHAIDRPSSFQRWLGVHRLEWRPGAGRNRFALGDYILYTGQNRGFDLAYFNPFNPFFSLNFEGYTWKEEVPDSSATTHADFDNNMLFAEFELWWPADPGRVQRHEFRSYGELLVDEFQIDEEDAAVMDNVWGATLGFEHRLHNLAYARSLRTQVEVSYCSHWLYNHPGWETDWFNRGRPLGNQEGADCLEYHVCLQWWPRAEAPFLGPNSYLELALSYLRKGNLEVGDPWLPDATTDEGLLTGPESGSLDLSLRLQHQVFCCKGEGLRRSLLPAVMWWLEPSQSWTRAAGGDRWEDRSELSCGIMLQWEIYAN